jgi:hypothetical protein
MSASEPPRTRRPVPWSRKAASHPAKAVKRPSDLADTRKVEYYAIWKVLLKALAISLFSVMTRWRAQMEME